jgi:nitrogen fixation protein
MYGGTVTAAGNGWHLHEPSTNRAYVPQKDMRQSATSEGWPQ